MIYLIITRKGGKPVRAFSTRKAANEWVGTHGVSLYAFTMIDFNKED